MADGDAGSRDERSRSGYVPTSPAMSLDESEEVPSLPLELSRPPPLPPAITGEPNSFCVCSFTLSLNRHLVWLSRMLMQDRVINKHFLSIRTDPQRGDRNPRIEASGADGKAEPTLRQ